MSAEHDTNANSNTELYPVEYSDSNPEAVNKQRRRHRVLMGGFAALTVIGLTTVTTVAEREDSVRVENTLPPTPETTVSSTETTTKTLPEWHEEKVMLAHIPSEFGYRSEHMPTATDAAMVAVRALNSLTNYDVINAAGNPPATIEEIKVIAANADIKLDGALWRVVEKDREPNTTYSYSQKAGSSYTIDPASLTDLGENPPSIEGIRSRYDANATLQLTKATLNTYSPTETKTGRPFFDAPGGEGKVNISTSWDPATKKVAVYINSATPFQFTS